MPASKPLKTKNAEWCVMDVETASDEWGSICEIAIIWRDQRGKYLDQYETVTSLPPGYVFEQDKTDLHNISEEDTEGYPNMLEVMRYLKSSLEDVKILAQNSEFEYKHLKGLKNPYPKIWVPDESWFLDTLRMSRYTYPREDKHKLENLITRYGIELDSSEQHRALYDAELLDQWFLEFVERHYDGDYEDAFIDYDQRDPQEGTYQWWKQKVPPTDAQADFVMVLNQQKYLSEEEIDSADYTKWAYSALIETAVDRRSRGVTLADEID